MSGRHEPYDMFEWREDRYVLEEAGVHGYNLAEIEKSLREQGFEEVVDPVFSTLLESSDYPIEVRLDMENNYVELDLGPNIADKDFLKGSRIYPDFEGGLFRMKEIEMHEAIDMGHTRFADMLEEVYRMDVLKLRNAASRIR